MIRTLLAAVLLVAMSWPASGQAQEAFDFISRTYASHVDFQRNKPAGEVTIKGRLVLPEGATVPLAVVVIAHASAGVTEDVPFVANAMRKAGYAALYFESYKPRLAQHVAKNGALANQTADAFAALKALANNPRFDVRRAAIVGMLAGGGAAILAATEYLRSIALGKSGPSYAAHVAFYLGLHMAPSADQLTGAPILIVQGADDNYMKPLRPQTWAAYIKRENLGATVELIMIPGAGHSFLTPQLRTKFLDDYVNVSLCPIILANKSGPKFLATDGTIHSSQPSCTPTRGATMGYNSSAAALGIETTLGFLKQNLN